MISNVLPSSDSRPVFTIKGGELLVKVDDADEYYDLNDLKDYDVALAKAVVLTGIAWRVDFPKLSVTTEEVPLVESLVEDWSELALGFGADNTKVFVERSSAGEYLRLEGGDLKGTKVLKNTSGRRTESVSLRHGMLYVKGAPAVPSWQKVTADVFADDVVPVKQAVHVPGLCAAEVKISLSEDVLHLTSADGRFLPKIRLPAHTPAENVRVSCRNGLLSVGVVTPTFDVPTTYV
jgi:hypothetical protein